MNENTPDAGPKGIARRRLLRGTFAAPAVLTLCSGGALAATSATCVAKAQANPVTGELITGTVPSTDTYLRVQLYQVTVDSTTTYWLSGNSISTFSGAGSIVQKDRYTRFLTDSNTLSNVAAEVNQTLTNPGLSSPAKWVALRFDGTGTLVGVGETGTGSAITGSCWNSIY